MSLPECRFLTFERSDAAQSRYPGDRRKWLHGSVTATVARRGLPGKMADDDLVCPPPVSARDHPARDAAGRNRVRAGLGHQSTRQETASSSQEERRLREGADDGADIVAWANRWPTGIST
jgi:hypothetical protein